MPGLSSRLTIWLAASPKVEVSREDRSVQIVAKVDSDDCLEIFIDPSLFPALRAAMNAAEVK